MSQTGKSKRNQRESNLAEKYQTDGPFTTVMIRNIPTEYTQDELIMEVSEVMGSPQFFDFFYLPWDTQNDCNIGYVFVNFPDPSAAQNAVRAFSNYHFRLHDSKKVGKVSPAHIQGLENNLRHLQDRAVVLGNHPCSPVVMWKGQKVELSLIFQELRTQDTLRKFESGHSSSPGHLQAQSDLAQAAAEALKGPMPQVANVGETFADLLDRAAGLSRSQGAVMNPGLVMPYMQRAALSASGQGMRQGGPGMLSPPGSVGSHYSMGTAQGGASPAAAAYSRMMAAGAQGYGNGSQPGLGQMVNMLQQSSVPCRPPGSDKGVSMGPPPGQFFARKPEQLSAPAPNALNAAAAPWPSPQDLAAMGLVADPNLYGMMQNRSACNQAWNVEEDIFGGDEQDGTPYDSRTPAVVSPKSWSGSPTAPPGLAPPPAGAQQVHDGGSNSRRSMLSPPSSASGRHALRPGLQSGCTSGSTTTGNGSPELGAPVNKQEPPAAVPNLAPSNIMGVKEINMKSADQNLLDKFMAKFGSP